MTLKSQILCNCRALLNHHHRQNQMVRRFSQFAFRSIPTNFHLPVDRRHSRPNPHLRNMTTQASPDTPSDSSVPTKTVRVVIGGRVQGVSYRSWTVETATKLGLKGWVKNRGDGTVEALFSGDADKVEEMQELCQTGPPLAVITKFTVAPSTEDPGTGFVRRESW